MDSSSTRQRKSEPKLEQFRDHAASAHAAAERMATRGSATSPELEKLGRDLAALRDELAAEVAAQNARRRG